MKKRNLISMIIGGVLLAIATFFDIMMFIQTKSYLSIVDLVLIVLTIIYSVYAYKNPSSDLMKYLFFIFAIEMAFYIFVAFSVNSIPLFAIYFVCALLATYMAGRLRKIEQNIYITSFIFVLLIVTKVLAIFTLDDIEPIVALFSFGQPIVWLVVSASYFMRYKTFRKAKLESEEKNADSESK